MPSTRPSNVRRTASGAKRPLRNKQTDKRLASSKITTGYSAQKGSMRVTISGITRDGSPGTRKRPITSKRTTNAPKGAFDLAIWKPGSSKKHRDLTSATKIVRNMEKNFYKTKQR